MTRNRRRLRKRAQSTQRQLGKSRRAGGPPKRIEVDHGTPQLREHRRHAAFNRESPKTYLGEETGLEFPLSLMRSRGLILVELYNAGMRFAADAWALYGEPFSGCQALYERMLAPGAALGDGRPTTVTDSTDALKRQLERRSRHAKRLAELRRGDDGRMLRAVRNISQFCYAPHWLTAAIDGSTPWLGDDAQRQLTVDGLQRLADLERERRPKRVERSAA